MGRKKYYCDFCNRYFNDDKNTRQKHCNSMGHINLRKEHYNMFRDPETLLKEESAKKPCRRFHNDGFCPFGGSCTYSHYSKQELDAVRQQLFIKSQQLRESITEALLLKCNQRFEEENQRSQELQWSCILPSELLPSVGLLPPSLLPYLISDVVENDLDSWG